MGRLLPNQKIRNLVEYHQLNLCLHLIRKKNLLDELAMQYKLKPSLTENFLVPGLIFPQLHRPLAYIRIFFYHYDKNRDTWKGILLQRLQPP